MRELARALVRLGEVDEAVGCLDVALDLAERHGDDNDVIAVRLNYSLALCSQSQHAAALHHARVAERITRRSRDVRYRAGAFTAVARQLACLGEYAAALPICEEGRERYVQVSNDGGAAQALCVLGFIHQNLENEDAAIACYEQALDLDRRINALY